MINNVIFYCLTVFSFYFLISCTSSPVDVRTKSPHYQDGKFQNPKKNDKSLWKFLKMRMKTDYADWPDWVESKYGSKPNGKNPENETVITMINHSTVLIQIEGLNILTDPIFSLRASPLSWIGPKRVRNPGLKKEDLPKIDAILISHDHYDHLDLNSIDYFVKRDNPKIFVGLGVGQYIKDKSLVFEMDWGQNQNLTEQLKIHFVSVQHFSGRGLFDRDSTLWGGFVIESQEQKIYFGGDSGYSDHYKKTFEQFGPMDISLLPVGAYEPSSFMTYAHLNPQEAVQAHIDLQSKSSIPIHYGTFQLTAEAINQPLIDLKLSIEKMNIEKTQFQAIEFGESRIFEVKKL